MARLKSCCLVKVKIKIKNWTVGAGGNRFGRMHDGDKSMIDNGQDEESKRQPPLVTMSHEGRPE